MLSEVHGVRQVAGEGPRRWFTDPYFDLIVWYDDDGAVSGFQLCYDKHWKERSFTWRKGHGCRHESVDSGETPGRLKMSPVVTETEPITGDDVASHFLRESAAIDPAVSRLVYETISATSRPSAVA